MPTLKKITVPLGISLATLLAVYMFCCSPDIRIGMSKSELIETLHAYDASAVRSILAGDTLVSIMPKNRHIDRPNRKYIVVFKADKLQRFEPFNIQFRSDFTHQQSSTRSEASSSLPALQNTKIDIAKQ